MREVQEPDQETSSLKMDSENLSEPNMERDECASKDKSLNVFDLIQVGINATFSIGLFVIISYVIKYIAGPSTIISVMIAATISFLSGHFFTEAILIILENKGVNETPLSNLLPKSSKLLLPSYALSYLCMGEWAGFAVAWNLLLEYAIGMAIVSKSLVKNFKSLNTDNNTMSAVSDALDPTDYFEFSSFFTPIFAAGEIIYNKKKYLSLIPLIFLRLRPAPAITSSIASADGDINNNGIHSASHFRCVHYTRRYLFPFQFDHSMNQA